MRVFFALIRFFIWGVCIAAVVTSVLAFFDQIRREDTDAAKTAFSTQALVWIFSAYFVARAFDLSTRSFEELCRGFRRRK
jgi:hypothetical protein